MNNFLNRYKLFNYFFYSTIFLLSTILY